MSQLSSDRNLLFGIMALQLDFVTRDALIEGMQCWVLQKQTTLAEILVNRNALANEKRVLLEPLVNAHIAEHGGDPAQSLAALSSFPPVMASLRALNDSQLEQSLQVLGCGVELFTADERPPSQISETMPEPAQERREPMRFQILRPHAEGGAGKSFGGR